MSQKTMKKLLMVTAIAAPLMMPSHTALAGGEHAGGHGKAAAGMSMDDMSMGGMSMDSMNMDGMSMDNMPADAMSGHQMDGHQMGGHAMGGHAHASWAEAPQAYAKRSFDRWDDYNVASKGMTLYQQNCMSCHGVDGKGTGPLAASLAHPPADLTNHFHKKPGDGDQYLFWRVTEGGTVAPFAAMDSAMPAFGNVLSEEDRWSVLTYVHQAFHAGFKSGPAMPAMPGMNHGGGHH